MKSWIGGEHVISQDAWAFSLVRKKGGSHCFLVLEGVDEKGDKATTDIHFGYYKDDRGVLDQRRGKIYVLPTSAERLQKINSQEYVCKTWHITLEEKKVIDRKVEQDQAREINYVKFGNTKTGGFFGASLDASGSTESKEASIEKNHSLLNRESASANSVHDSVDAALRKGHSCVSWAIETVKSVRPDFKESMLGKFVVVVPQIEVPDTRICMIL